MTMSWYMMKIKALMDAGTATDGCTTPFKTQIHRIFGRAKLLCAGHDYAQRGLLVPNVFPGWHNNWWTLKAHWAINPGYGIWGTIVAIATLPWIVANGNLGLPRRAFIPFHVILLCLASFFLFIHDAEAAPQSSGYIADWHHPTTREGGKPIDRKAIAGYRVLYGPGSGNYTDSEKVGNTCLWGLNPWGDLKTYICNPCNAVITVIDTDGRESLFSDEVKVEVTGRESFYQKLRWNWRYMTCWWR